VGNAALVKLSPFFENLKPVKLGDGQTRLWNPDLTPYRVTDQILPASIPS
jgi:hypothetical protein